MKDRFVSLIVTGLLIAVLSGQAGAQLLFKHGEVIRIMLSKGPCV